MNDYLHGASCMVVFGHRICLEYHQTEKKFGFDIVIQTIVYFQSIILKVFGLCIIALYALLIIVVSCWNSAERIASDGNGIPLRTFTSDKQITYSLGAWASE